MNFEGVKRKQASAREFFDQTIVRERDDLFKYLHNANNAEEQQRKVDIEVPEIDKDRKYEFFRLSNHLRVMVISDPKTEKAAAAMDIRVGHLSDPLEFPGLAHFLGFLFFMSLKN